MRNGIVDNFVWSSSPQDRLARVDRSPVLITQSKCDDPSQEVRRFDVPAETVSALGYCKELHYSAMNQRGAAALYEALADASAWLHHPERAGQAMIGAGRMRVKRQIEAMRDADASKPPEHRKHRTLTHAEFTKLCQDTGGISSPDETLQYLHASGLVFYRKGLFGDRIVLDQAWALDAIYAIFNREKCFRQLRHWRGRFTRSLLELLVWQGYAPAEQQLFLSMMVSCGVCFLHRSGSRWEDRENEYVAPDLLPDRATVQSELEERWPATESAEIATFEYEFLHPALMSGVISRIGSAAGANALYWRGGLCVYETTTRSRALIEEEKSENWRGLIRLQTQGGQAAALLHELMREVEFEQERFDLRAERIERASQLPVPGRLHNATTFKVDKDPGKPERMLLFGEPATTRPQLFVSYAWGDSTSEGVEREAVVDRLCETAQKKGFRIRRDKNELSFGDSLSLFMRQVGAADRVYLVLSDKYLKSPNCMFELFEIWRNSKQEEEMFRARVRIFSLPDAQIWCSEDRIKYAKYWTERHDRLRRLAVAAPIDTLGVNDVLQLKRMRRWSEEISDVLATIADTLHPRSLNDMSELEQYWF